MAKTIALYLALSCLCGGFRVAVAQSCEVAVAKSQLHVREKTNRNDGPEVAQFLRAVNIHNPAPWCGAFAAWVLDSCGADHNMTGMAVSCCPNDDGLIFDKGKKRMPNNVPEGALFFWLRPGGGHNGFVVDWPEHGDYFTRIDGNTSTADGKEGVAKKKALKRNVQKLYKYYTPCWGSHCFTSEKEAAYSPEKQESVSIIETPVSNSDTKPLTRHLVWILPLLILIYQES
ncbi:MAG: hypothetical protein LAT81_16190 [Oceanicaulis sp.]|nr:hypothetical protein [Oceanicaulis sp.]